MEVRPEEQVTRTRQMGETPQPPDKDFEHIPFDGLEVEGVALSHRLDHDGFPAAGRSVH